MTIKPLAGGQLRPYQGLSFVWNTIRDQDMVTIGTTTPDEAREVIDLSMDFLEKRLPDFEMKVSTDMPEFFPWWEERRFSD